MMKIQREKVYLSKLEKEVFLNPISIADDEWMTEKWDKETLGNAFRDVNVDILFEIFWRILDVEGKRLIAKAQIIEYVGMKETVLEIDEPVEKLKKIVAGGKEIMSIMMAIYETRVKSNPDPVSNQKKSLKEELPLGTQKSSTSSPQSTDSTKTSSEPSPDVNSLT